MQNQYDPSFCWLFITEVKGIQQFILRTDKLKHMVGASQIVAELPRKYLETCLKEFDLLDHCLPVTQAAGRAIMLFSNEDKIRHFYSVWPILANDFAPNIEIIQALVEVKNGDLSSARAEAQKILLMKRQQQQSRLPLPGPLSERCRRDGLATARMHSKEGPISHEISHKLAVADDVNRKNDLLRCFSDKELNWPIDFSEIAGDEKDYLAIIHADANGMGKVLMEVNEKLAKASPEKVIATTHEISDTIHDAAVQSAKKATLKILESLAHSSTNPVPMRPLVLAGDDLTIVIKAPLALTFLETYMRTFQEASTEKLKKLLNNLDISFLGFSVSAGVTFARANYPFKAAYELCEELCKKGKQKSARAFSTISFWRQSNATSDGLENLIERELTVENDNEKIILTCEAYALEENKELPCLKDLNEAIDSMHGLPRGSLRQLAAECYTGRKATIRAWERFKDIATERDNAHQNHKKTSYQRFSEAMKKMSGDSHDELWRKNKNDQNSYSTPLLDVIGLFSATSGNTQR